MSDELKGSILGFSLVNVLLSIVGICNGLASQSSNCSNAYLDLRKPIHYVLPGHTVGYYFGRFLAHPFGEVKFKTQCDSIFNETMKGPKDEAWLDLNPKEFYLGMVDIKTGRIE